MLKYLFKEASLLFAFIVLGGLLLFCFWITHNVNQSILKEFKNSQISVVLKDGADEKFRQLVEKNENVIRYDFFSPSKNRERLGELYPELKNLVEPLDEKFFPASAVVTVRNPDAFWESIKASPDLFQAQLLHKPPTELSEFLKVLLLVFSVLWLLTLGLVLYFNLERLAQKEEARWSLMKMLGARPFGLLLPFWYGQTARIAIASAFAMVFASFISREVRGFFVWNWVGLPFSIWFAFVLVSLFMTTGISFALFYFRYKRVSIG